MKLKKIASLALAGIMAVSMLAGCKTADNNGEEENPVVPTATNAVGYAEDALNATLKDDLGVKVVADSTLDAWTKEIATDVKKLSKDDLWYAYTYPDKIAADSDNTMSKALVDKLKENGPVASTSFKSMPTSGYEQSNGWMYAVSGKLDEKSAVELAMSKVNSDVSAMCESTVKSGDTVYDADYTMEISTLKVKNSSSSDTAWVVSVILTQELTKAANSTI